MPIHIKADGGYVRSGLLYGTGEIYNSDNIGNGTIHKGNFVKSRLNDADGTMITYSNTEITLYKGVFVNNQMDGQITIITYTNTLPEEEDEKEVEGNCLCHTQNRRFIYLSNNQTPMIAKKKVVLYNNGVEESVISEEVDITITLNVSQFDFNGKKIFNNFMLNQDE
jgi:hypothetical protein